jgi:hypothetical protein
MVTKKKGKQPTGRSSENASERKAWASESAVSFVASAVSDANTIAIQCIDTMLMEMYRVFAWLVDNGFDREQFAVLMNCFAQLKWCLLEVGPSRTIQAVEALHGFWLHDGAVAHEQYFMAAGLEELAKECFRVIQDAIAMSTILFPEIYQHIIDMGVEVRLMSRLHHAHFIMKRYLRDVGEKLLQMSEVPINCVEKKAAALVSKKAAAALPVHPHQRAQDWLEEATSGLMRELA